MNRELRVQKLAEIKAGRAYGTGISIPYQDKLYNKYQIPWEFLIYNKYNGRIRSLVKTYEAQYHALDPEKAEDVQKIEDFLWKSNEGRNKATLENIAEFGQRINGIVTADGKIIDGNRRAMMVKKVYSGRNTTWDGQDVESCKYFIAVILDDDIDDSDIRRLETIYQMGEDAKLDYNAIEKYLMVKELLEDVKFNEEDVAKWMNQTPGKVREWRETMRLMDEYLNELGYNEIYTMLDEREDLFLSLNKYIKRYRSGNNHADWGFDQEKDVEDLKLVSYDYIRAQTDGKLFRSIGQGSEGENFFSNKTIWQLFKKSHFENVEPISENERSVDEWRNDNRDGDISDILLTRDKEWLENVKEHLDSNFTRATSQLENKLARNKPRQLIEKARDALNSINTEVAQIVDEGLDEILAEIISQTNLLRKFFRSNINE